MKLSDHRALQGALLFSAAIFTICQARPQFTGTSTTTLGNAEVASLSQENAKSEEEATRYNASAHSSSFLTANNTSNLTNGIWLESTSTITDASRNITGYPIYHSSLYSKYNVTAIGSKDSGSKVGNNRLEKGNMAVLKEGLKSQVGIFKNDTNSQDYLSNLNSTLQDHVKNKSLQHLEHFSKVALDGIGAITASLELNDISTNSHIHHENKSNNLLEQNISKLHQEVHNSSSKILNSTQGLNCSQLRLGTQPSGIDKNDEYISLKSSPQPFLHNDTNNYSTILEPKSSPWQMPAYVYAQQSPVVQEDILRDDGIIPSYLQNSSVNQSNLSGVTSEHPVTMKAANQEGQYEITSENVLPILMNLTAAIPRYLSHTSENMSYNTATNAQINISGANLYPSQNMSLHTLNTSRARTESGQTGVPQGLHIAAEFLKNQNVIETMKKWGGSLISKFSKIFTQSYGVPSVEENKYSTTEASRAISAVRGSNRKGKIFLKNGTKPLQLVYFVPAESTLVTKDRYSQPKTVLPKNQSPGTKENVFSSANENNITDVYRRRHNSTRNGNITRPQVSVIRRKANEKLLPKIRTRLIRRNNYTNLTEERKQLTRQYLPIKVHSDKNNSSGISRASNMTHELFNNVSNGMANQVSSWLPIGLPSQTESPKNLQFSQSRNSGKECVIKSNTGEIRPCNRKRNATEITQKQLQNSNQTPKTLLRGDGLVKNFVATNIDDLRTPSKELPNENIATPSSSLPPFAFHKNWPGDSSGIESLDDLILYHTYTQNKPSVTVKPQADGGYVGVIKKPSVTLDWNQNPSTSASSTTVTYKPSQTSKRPAITVQNTKYVYDYDYNSGSSATHGVSDIPYTTMYPVVLITPRPTHQPSTHSPYYPPSYGPPLAHDEFYDDQYSPPLPPVAAPSKCPNIIISTKGNATKGTKENCPDVNILITSDITNNNVLVGASSTTTAANSPPLFDEGFATTIAPTMVSPPTSLTSTLSNIVTGMMSSQLAYPMLYFFLAPLLVVVTGGIGLAALMFPWMFAWRSLGREERGLQKKSLLVQEFDQRRKRRSVRNTCSCWDWNLDSKGFSEMLHSGKKKPMRSKRSHEFLDSYHLWWVDDNT